MSDSLDADEEEDSKEALEEILSSSKPSSKASFDPEKMWGKHHTCGSECKPDCSMSEYKSAQAFTAGIRLETACGPSNQNNPTPASSGVAAVVATIATVGQAASAPEDPGAEADLMSLAYRLNLRLTKENADLKRQLAEATAKHKTLVTKLEEVRALIGSIVT